MAILKGEAARQWLAQNPGRGYTNLTTSQSVPQQQSGIGRFLSNITKPIRTFLPAVQESAYTLQDLVSAGKGDWRTAERPDKYLGMNQEESTAFREDPLKQGLKAGSALISYGMPTGPAASAVTPGARIASAAGRSAIPGAMSGFGYSDEGEELSGALTGGALGGLIGGATQGIGEASRAIKARPQGGGKVVNTMEVDEIAKLPNKTRSGLVKQAKSAGFWDDKISESKNIQNYLSNRGLAGNTPAETLENLTQEFNRASQLKQEGLEEIGGLGRGYIDQAKNNIDEAIKFKGLIGDPDGLRAYEAVMDSLSPGGAGLSAKDLDKLIMKWNEAGRLASGAQKTSAAGIYADAAQELRNIMRTVPGAQKYDTALQALNQVLGIEDVGAVAGAAKTAAGGGLDLPLFSGAGFRGADIKTPAVSNTISRARAAVGRAQEAGQGLGGGALSGILGAAAPVANVAQRATPGIVGAAQSLPARQEQPQLEGLGGMLPPQEQGPQIDESALINAVLSGQISRGDAEWLMEMLGGANEQTSTLETAISELERLYGAGTPQSLSLGDKSTGVGGLINKGVAAGRGALDQGFADRKAAYDQARALAVGIINKAREAGVLNEGEYEVMIQNMPNEYTTERVAQDWFQNVRRMLANSGKSEETNNAAITNIMPWIAQ